MKLVDSARTAMFCFVPVHKVKSHNFARIVLTLAKRSAKRSGPPPLCMTPLLESSEVPPVPEWEKLGNSEMWLVKNIQEEMSLFQRGHSSLVTLANMYTTLTFASAN